MVKKIMILKKMKLIQIATALLLVFGFLQVESRIVDTIEALNDKKIGEESAKIKIIEFASLTCGHCAKFHNEVFPKIKEEFIDTGKVLFTYKDFPLDKFALKASVIARCSGEKKFLVFSRFSTVSRKIGQEPRILFVHFLKLPNLVD